MSGKVFLGTSGIADTQSMDNTNSVVSIRPTYLLVNLFLAGIPTVSVEARRAALKSNPRKGPEHRRTRILYDNCVARRISSSTQIPANPKSCQILRGPRPEVGIPPWPSCGNPDIYLGFETPISVYASLPGRASTILSWKAEHRGIKSPHMFGSLVKCIVLRRGDPTWP